MSLGPSRRGFLKGAAIAAGLFGASRLPGVRLLGRAHAAPGDEAPALFVLYLRGGYNALFPSADSFVGSGAFGVTSNNIRRVGTSDVFLDRGTLGSMPDLALQHVASIGVRHGISAHPSAQRALFMDGDKSYLIQLSRALGGTVAGDAPDRALAADGLAAAEAMSGRALEANPASGATLVEGYPAAVGMLSQGAVALDYAELAGAYGVTAGAGGALPTAVRNVGMQIMGAELMIRAGANLVVATNPGWDSHDDRDGSEVRTRMANSGITAALRTFLGRTMAMPDRNVVTLILGDFSRSLPGSDHQANLTASVFGKHVKVGTTGRVNARVGLPEGTPGIEGMWAYLSAALKAPERPFGADPHRLVLP